MLLNVTAPVCNDQQLIFRILYFLVTVIVARVKKVLQPDAMSRVYKVNIKKEFKVSLNQHGTFLIDPNTTLKMTFVHYSDNRNSKSVIHVCGLQMGLIMFVSSLLTHLFNRFAPYSGFLKIWELLKRF
jgi:hypothetical protein